MGEDIAHILMVDGKVDNVEVEVVPTRVVLCSVSGDRKRCLM